MANDVKQKLTEIGEKILANARNELYYAMRFFDIALSSLEYEFNLGTFFVGTDGVYIYYNPRFLMERYKYQPIIVNRAYLHMVLHCIFRHMYDTEQREEEEWNLSCDIAIEFIIDSLDYKAVRRVVSDYRTEVYEKLSEKLKVLTAEGIYKYLMEEDIPYIDFVKLQTEFLVDDHVFWNAKKRDNESNNNSKDENKNNKSQDSKDNNHNNDIEDKQKQEQQKNWIKVSEKMKTNLETFAANLGNEAGTLLKSLNIDTRERYDYRQFLKKFAVSREVMQVDMDSFDYGFYNYGIQTYGNMPLVEALEYKEVEKIEEFVIAIDTSGSCSGELVKQFLEKTYSILKSTESFLKKVHIHIIQCDMEIKEDVVIRSLEEFELYKEEFTIKGFGGTDFRPVFSYVDSLIQQKQMKQLKGLIYFTDGYGIYPKMRPEYDVAFIFLKDDYTDTDVPLWAMKLILSSEDIGR